MSGGRGRGLRERPRAPPETARERGPRRRRRRRAGPRGRRGRGDGAAAGGSERGRLGGLGDGQEAFPGTLRPSCRVRTFPGTRGARAAGPASCGVGPGLTGRSVAVLGRGAAAACPLRRAGHGWPGPGRAPARLPPRPGVRALLAAQLSVLLPGATWAAPGAATRLSPGASRFRARRIPGREK